MKDIESIVITALMTATGSSATIGSIYNNAPSSFPYISVIESDNSLVYDDDGDSEKYSDITYEINVYTNSSAPKSDARGLMKTVDDTLYRMNFRRTQMRSLPNVDSSIYRLYALYEAVTDGTNIYRR